VAMTSWGNYMGSGIILLNAVWGVLKSAKNKRGGQNLCHCPDQVRVHRVDS
jgi:hypothetical protein